MQECRIIADLAEPPDLKQAFDASLSVVLLQVHQLPYL